MSRAKKLINIILLRTITATFVCSLVLLITGNIGDAAGYLGYQKFVATGSRTELATQIFQYLPNFNYFYILFNIQIY